MTSGGLGAINAGIKRFDDDSGKSASFDFGGLSAVGELLCAANPGGHENEGWLITQVLDGVNKTTYFAILDASNVSVGPLAKIWLSHHMPVSFHGASKAG